MTPGPVRIGCSGWNYADWRGRVYPRGCPPRRWLAHYATLFDTVEVNSTFYRLASPDAVARWVAETPPDFVLRRQGEPLPDARQAAQRARQGVDRLYAGIAPLAESPKLGPVLWQLPANFHRDDDRLGARAGTAPAGPPRVRVPPRELVHVRGLRAAAHVRRRVRARRRPAPPAAGARAHGGLDVSALPLRPPRPPRQLLRDRAARVGGADRGAARRAWRCSRTSTTTGRGSRSATDGVSGSCSRVEACRDGAKFYCRVAGWSSQVARRAHNPKVAGSNPAPAIGKRHAGPEGRPSGGLRR